MMEERVQTDAPVMDDRKKKLWLTVASAVAVAVVFQAQTMAYNNYNVWRLQFTVLELACALAGSFGANLVQGIEERGVTWAKGLVPSQEGWLFHLLSVLPAVCVRAAIICAFVSIPNATAVPMLIYREEVVLPPLAVLIRFLGDLPAAVVVCLAARLLVERYVLRQR